MKELFLLFSIILFSSLNSFAQEALSEKIKCKNYSDDIGVLFDLQGNVKMIYNKKISNKNSIRFQLDINDFQFGNGSQSLLPSFAGIDGGLSINFEKYKRLNNLFSFFHGPGLGVNASIQVNSLDVLSRISYRAFYATGFKLRLNQYFQVMAEIQPSMQIEVRSNRYKATLQPIFNVGFSTNIS